MDMYRRDSRGAAVADIQGRLSALGYQLGPEGVDGWFGPNTETAILAFQQQRGILCDGVVGPNTWRELVEACRVPGERTLYLRQPPFRGDDVLDLQRWLNTLGFDSGPEDGIFGPETDGALRQLQRDSALPADGMLGGKTLETIGLLRSSLTINKKVKLPDKSEGYAFPVTTLEGKRITVDPGHGGRDRGLTGPAGSCEADLNLAIARALAEELGRRGADPSLARERDESVSVYDRVERSNGDGSALYLSIHLTGTASPLAGGASAYYFANGIYFSEAGHRMAGCVLRRILGRLPVRDDRCHGVNYAVLRESFVPSIQIEPGFITNLEEEALLCLPETHSTVAAAAADGLADYLARR